MRLINVQTEQLEDFTLKPKPKYAILSHTWEVDEEVSYQDLVGSHNLRKKGWTKLRQTCRLARKDELRYVWIDTCCIDKTSSAELSEAINSMYAWYAGSERCYVALSDLMSPADDIMMCRWWNRGWTLQELIAPSHLYFYDRTWTCAGRRSDIVKGIENAKGVPADLLNRRSNLCDYSVAARMSWASERTTTRPEDEAYCLLGIFDIAMPLIYGEGKKAFRRLQEEIMKQGTDLSILAGTVSSATELLSGSTASYRGMSSYRSLYTSFDELSGLEAVLTGKGIRFSGGVPMLTTRSSCDDPFTRRTYFLPLADVTDAYPDNVVALYLRKLSPSSYQRHPTMQTGIIPSTTFHEALDDAADHNETATTMYLVSEGQEWDKFRVRDWRGQTLLRTDRIDTMFEIQRRHPRTYWDAESGLCLHGTWSAEPMYVGIIVVSSKGTGHDFLLYWHYSRRVEALKAFIAVIDDDKESLQNFMDDRYHGIFHDELRAFLGIKTSSDEAIVVVKGKARTFRVFLSQTDHHPKLHDLEITTEVSEK